MARGPQVRVEGAAKLRRALRAAGRDLTELKEANRRAAELVARKASARAPRRSGRLAGSLRPSKAARAARILAGSAGVPYAGPIHWGWEARHIEPQPFISDTAEDTRPEWLRAYEADVDRIIKQIES